MQFQTAPVQQTILSYSGSLLFSFLPPITYLVGCAPSRTGSQRLTPLSRFDLRRLTVASLISPRCSECGAELASDSFLFMETEQPLCRPCARLGDLEYLPAGDTALTRRAAKYSGRTAVVVRFSKSRGRYERQGILVENAALEGAERECSLHADARATARERAAALRREQDRELIARMTRQMLILFPGCPPDEASEIANTAAITGGANRFCARRPLALGQRMPGRAEPNIWSSS